MKDYNDVIIRMDALVNRYWGVQGLDGPTLNDLLKQVTSCLYYLETVRSDIHNSFQVEINKLVESGKSVARAQNCAHVKHPDMYRLRRVMEAGYEVVGAIRTNISYLKSEMNNMN